MEIVKRTARVHYTVSQTKVQTRACEMCGATFVIDPESGEYCCPVCDIPEE